jgi:asparagine synthase (glutamine-hydrolysing)
VKGGLKIADKRISKGKVYDGFTKIRGKLKVLQRKNSEVSRNTHADGSEKSTIERLIDKIQEDKLTYLERDALCDLAEVVRDIEDNHLGGMIVEAGCALGGSSLLLAKAKGKERPLFVYDAFDMIPPPSKRDGKDVKDRYEEIKSGKSRGINGDRYYGYEQDLYTKVFQTFNQYGLDVNENNIRLIKGLFQETLHINAPVTLAHIDCDWYESVLTCLERIEPHLVSGGIMIIDDYHAWSGCKEAVKDYFSHKNIDNYKFITRSRLHIIKK